MSRTTTGQRDGAKKIPGGKYWGKLLKYHVTEQSNIDLFHYHFIFFSKIRNQAEIMQPNLGVEGCFVCLFCVGGFSVGWLLCCFVCFFL